ncbi:protein FAM228B-like isoform X3 [Mercenaria mercenaria]|uniref:protein FAM228B-like isoform X3 n=1 Tax=Mercenaria mercenaria TaxID=6596 RepID=UPI00234F19E8|nr:protein FAM228B-like isoform X3 [Mercenaria mercenaria]
MTSMLCRKETGGQVHVHDNVMIESLGVDDNDKIRTLMMSKQNSARRRRMPRPNTTPTPSRSSSRNMDTSSLIGQTMRVQHWLNDKTVKTLQEKSDLESKAARQLYSPLLQTENTFVKDVEDYITRRDVTDLRKKEVLHKNWSERVYKPLRKKIIEAMDSNDWPEVDRRKRELHRQYLEFTNAKGHVFLDTIDPEEYYAMALNGHRPAPIKDEKNSAEVDKCKASQKKEEKLFKKEIQKMDKFIKTTIETRPLHDPLISQGRQRSEEDRTILRCMTGYRYSDKDIEQVKMPAMPLVPLGRHGTDSVRWLKMPLENIESSPRLASRRRMRGNFNDTGIDFGEWSKAPYNHAEVDRELQIQKKRQYPEDQRPPFPKPVIQKVTLKPVRNVSFHDPVVQEPESLAVQPLTQAMQQTNIGVGTD